MSDLIQQQLVYFVEFIRLMKVSLSFGLAYHLSTDQAASLTDESEQFVEAGYQSNFQFGSFA